MRRRPDGDHPEQAAWVLVLGVLGILACGAFGIPAWWLGSRSARESRAAGRAPETIVRVGRALGIVAVVIWTLGIVVFVHALVTIEDLMPLLAPG